MIFESPSRGRLSFEEMFGELLRYLGEDPEARYKLIVGTDSHTRNDTIFVTAVIIHRVGKGGRYFFSKSQRRAVRSLRQKILYETSVSLGIAARLTDALQRSGFSDLDVDIHIDVGQQGETRDLIREIVGMVTGSGYHATIKPDSFGASKVADKYTK
ncbi:MAG: ribonuclease H-like YkuK family protein [Firmicutes bacterium]|nr:ribonuclease H-like YkuK family protein [Alicyclobacillaceae bacterium]MCL6497224.1 ribonuclease H-like YkuK family protein [Bacillota bacterium]